MALQAGFWANIGAVFQAKKVLLNCPPDKPETRSIRDKDIKSEAASEVRLVFKAYREKTEPSLETILETEGFQGFEIVPEEPQRETSFTTPGVKSPMESPTPVQINKSHTSPSNSKKWQKDSWGVIQ